MKKDISYFKNIVVEASTTKESLSQIKLPYKRSDLDPVLSEKNIDIHFGKLAKGYVTRFNDGEGDPEFNRGGALLHNILFSQFKPVSGSNQPPEEFVSFIEKKYKTFDNFKKTFIETAMKIQGSGWIYLDRRADIKTIKNHDIPKDQSSIILLIDWWEHAWFIDYGSDKEKYANNIWRIIDWRIITDRLSLNSNMSK